MKSISCRIFLFSMIMATVGGVAATSASEVGYAEIDTLILLEDLVESGELDDPDLLATVYDGLRPLLTGAVGHMQAEVVVRNNSQVIGVNSRAEHHALAAGRRHHADGTVSTANLVVSVGGVSLAGGQLAFQQGFGLMVAGAGRRSSVSQALPLMPPDDHWRGYRGMPNARSLDGGALAFRTGFLDLDVLHGRTGDGGIITDLFSIGFSGRASAVKVLFLEQDQWRGTSLTLRLGEGRDRVAAEISSGFGDDHSPEPPNAALAFSRGIGSVTVSGVYVSTSGGSVSPLALRPATIGAWGGRGWAMRAVIKMDRGFQVNLLGAGSVDPVTPDSAYRSGIDQRFEVGLTRRWNNRISFSLRLRSQLESTTGWDDRSVWMHAAWQREIRKFQIYSRWEYEASQGRIRLTGRYLESVKNSIDDGFQPDDRTLLTLEFRSNPLAHLRFACSLDRAWGGSADLCSVAVPVSGVMTPLHWGHWQEGLSIGLEFRTDQLRAGLSYRYRLPEDTASRSMDQETAFSAGFYW